jgi:hypothetical protein
LSPILVRPVREQLEHDRVIRLLQAKYKRKFDVAINPGNEQSAPVGTGPSPWYPDLVLQERGHKLVGVVEVETAESVNNLEAMSQWVAFGKLRAQFHLYVPASAIDSTRRLCGDLAIPVAEIWAYHSIGDQLRFTLVQKSGPGLPKGSPEPRVAQPKAAVNGAGGRAPEKAAKPAPAAAKPVAAPVPKKAKAVPAPKAAAVPAPKKTAVKPKAAPVPAKKAAPVAAKKPAAKPVSVAKPGNGGVAKPANGKKKTAAPAPKTAKRR